MRQQATEKKMGISKELTIRPVTIQSFGNLNYCTRHNTKANKQNKPHGTYGSNSIELCKLKPERAVVSPWGNS